MTMVREPEDASARLAAKLFRGLADPTRLAILLALQAGERRVVDLVTELGSSQANISGHLACLKDCGLVTDRAQGRANIYRLARPELATLLQAAVAVTFFLLAPYIAGDAIRALVVGDHAQTSWLGIGISIASLIVMPALGIAKKRIGARLGSPATSGEGTQNLLCAYLAAAVLAGLLANTWFGLWWLDPAVALVIAALAIQEGREAWNGEDCRA